MFESKHIWGLSVAVVFVIAFFTIFFFVNPKLSREKGRTYVLRSIAGTMIFLEFCKMVFALATEGGITKELFPWQLCSMPLLLFPLVAFGGEKMRKIFCPPAFIIGMLAGTIVLFYPANVLDTSIPWFENGGINLPMHSFIYHTLMIVFAGYMIQSKVYRIRAWDFLYAAGIMLSMALVAICLNTIIPGADYFLLGKGTGLLPPEVLEKIGTSLFAFLFICVGMLIVFLFYSYWIFKAWIQRIRKRKQPDAL